MGRSRRRAGGAAGGGPDRPTPLIVVMGVMGSGKTAIGSALGRRLGCDFLDGDGCHPATNVAKVHRGEPLDDRDRAPWLAALRARLLAAQAERRPLAVACSALRAAHRPALGGGLANVVLVHLTGARWLIAARLAARCGHFMASSLLGSQLEALEPPDDAITVDVGPPVPAVVDAIVA